VSAPSGKPTTLTDPSLYDGSTVGAWQKRFEQVAQEPAAVVSQPAPPAAAPVPAVSQAAPAPPPINPAALAATANAGLVKELEARAGSKPLSADEMSAIRTRMAAGQPGTAAAPSPIKPVTLAAPRGGKADDLKLIYGVGPKLERRLNQLGIYHFDQIAGLNAASVLWLEDQLDDAFGSASRDKWVEQAGKLASGWRPKSQAGDKPGGKG
jgi:NADH-quinone oxidoreductase subunit E